MSTEKDTNRSSTKYGQMIEDHDWSEPESEPDELERTSVKRHEVDVIYVTDPGETGGYGRERYTATVDYDDTGEPYILYVVEHRWKGNYWRDVTDWDWRDVPVPVREQIASVLPVDRPRDLDCGDRMIDEGGESRWEKYHKPRVDSMDGSEMWAVSHLTDAVKSLEGAAEDLDGDTGTDRVEELVEEVRETIADIQDGEN